MIIYTIRAYSRKAGHVCGITKKRESLANGHNYDFFPPNFTNLGHLECHTLPKQNVVLKVFTENELFHYPNRALHTGTSSNKWLKEPSDCSTKLEYKLALE